MHLINDRETLLKAILDNMTDNIVLMNNDHKVICFNDLIRQTLVNYFGKDITIGDDYRDFVIGPLRDLYLSSFDKALNGETILVEIETNDGSFSRWFQYKVNPVYDPAHEMVGVVLIATDIDERKRKEIALLESQIVIEGHADELAKSERYFRTIIETSSDAIVLLDATGQVIYQTPSVEKITGYSLEEMQSVDGLDLIYPDDRQKDNEAFLKMAAVPGKILRSKHRLKRKDGAYFWLEGVYRNLLNDPDVGAIVFNYADVTEKEHFIDALNKANRELQLLTKVNDLILKATDEQVLLDEVCKCIIFSGGYKLAWVGFMPLSSDAEKKVRQVSACGEISYLSEITISLSDETKGPTATVLLTGKPFINNQASIAPEFRQWRDRAARHGIYASLVLPLMLHDEIAALNIYSGHENAFDHHEFSILSRLADNISLALKNIQTRKEKEKAVYLLKERVKELSTIYQVNEILKVESQTVSEVFTRIVNVLPPGWQYPEVCQARIHFDCNDYTTKGYKASAFSQEAKFELMDGRKGLIEVVYTREVPAEYEGVFLKEERDLINTVAETIKVYFNKVSQHRALLLSEAKFRGAFEYAAIGMALVSPEGQWLMVNKSLCEMLGYSEQEMLQLTFQSVTHPDDIAIDTELQQRMLNGEISFFRSEKRYVHKDGESIWINVNVSLVRDDAGAPLYFVSQIEDITTKKILELERQRAVEDLVQRNTDLEEFSQIVSHNIRGPLATILGLNNMLLEDVSDEERSFILDGIRSSTDRLDSVVRDLNVILQTRRELSESRTPVNLEQLVFELKLSIALMIRSSGATIRTDFSAGNELLTVRSYLNSIFYNVITNSIKFAMPGRKPVIDISSEVDGSVFKIIFRDNGNGIDMDRFGDKVFHLYQRFDLSVEGRGLGLFMTKAQVEALNGKVSMNSRVGEGTVVTVSLPIVG